MPQTLRDTAAGRSRRDQCVFPPVGSASKRRIRTVGAQTYCGAMKPSARLGGLLVVTMLTVANSPHALAATRTKSDPQGDAPARLDVIKATYTNSRPAVTVHLVIPELERRGSVRLVIGPPQDGDGSLVAQVSVRPDGSINRQFFTGTVVGTVPERCAFKAKWNAEKGRISISVPWPCIRRVGGSYFGTGKLYLGAVTGAGVDFANPVRRLGRG